MTDSIIVVYGKTGQVASSLANFLKDKAIFFASTEYDFSNISTIEQTLNKLTIKAIINATAYTDVNKAESEEDAAYKANTLIPKAIAQYCYNKTIPFIHFSTDYVFSGEGIHKQTELDKTTPLNAYGRSKLSGEKEIINIGGKYIILRTSWLYDHKRKNFLTTMLKLGAENEELSVVCDQFGAPTYVPHLCEATLDILEKSLNKKSFPSGVYNLCNIGETTWHGFAIEIFKEAKKNKIPLKIISVKAISSDDFPTPAKRPKNSRLDCSLIQKVFDVNMPSWQDGLACAIKLISSQ